MTTSERAREGARAMRAAFMPAAARLETAEFPIPSLTAGQVLVEMHYASVCGSDVHVVHAGFHNPEALGHPGYPGHEGVGLVVESRSERVPVGTTVLTVPQGTSGGCFAEYQAVDDCQLVPLPDGCDERRLLMAQQLGTVVFAMRKFLRPPVTTAGVIGVGSAGLFFVQLLLRAGCSTVIASDVDPGRLAVAERLGATPVLATSDASFPDAVLGATGGLGAELVVETAGLDACRAQAVAALRLHGTVGCFGYAERLGLAPFPVHAAFRKAATVAWVRDTQSEPGLASFREAVELLESGAVDVEDHVRHVLPLEEAPRGLEQAHRREVVKVVLEMPAVRSSTWDSATRA